MKKLLIAAAASSVVLLAGCASGPDEATQQKMDDLTNQVSQLRVDVDGLKADSAVSHDQAQKALEEAMRANQRIDKIGQSYTK